MSDIKGKPKLANSVAELELEKATNQIKEFEQNIKDLTLDRMNAAPKEDKDMQTQLSSRDIAKSKDIYLKPKKTLSDRQKFNEEFRKDWEFSKEYVHFIAENKDMIGETIEMWTHPFGGVGAEFWEIPTNKPVWGPRYVAEQIKRCNYHRLVMNNTTLTGSDGMGTYHGTMVADSIVQRLDAHPVGQKKSLFIGAN